MTGRQRTAVVLALLAAVTVVGLSLVPETSELEALTVERAVAEAPTSTDTSPPPSTTTTTTLPPLPPGGLQSGSSGPEVMALERRLAERHYDPGEVDGEYDSATRFAVMALEKVAGMEPSGRVDPLVWGALAGLPDPVPMLPNGGDRRVEIDKVRQLLFLYEEGELTLISHTSTGSEVPYCEKGGCGSAVTPTGSHRFLWRVNGWRQSRLGRLYNPVYFTSYGIAIHGFPSVPTHPASHGCVRIPMHTAEWFPDRVQQHDAVYVFDGTTAVQPIEPAEGEGPDGSVGDGGVDDGGGPAPSPDGWLDGEPPPPVPTTGPPTFLA